MRLPCQGSWREAPEGWLELCSSHLKLFPAVRTPGRPSVSCGAMAAPALPGPASVCLAALPIHLLLWGYVINLSKYRCFTVGAALPPARLPRRMQKNGRAPLRMVDRDAMRLAFALRRFDGRYNTLS